MNAGDPTGMLMTEHRLIERVIEDMRRVSEAADPGSAPSAAYVRTVTDFISTYADACHHGKEEDILFARLSDKTLDEEHAHAMQGLIREHAWAREATRRLHDAGERLGTGDTAALEDVRRGMKALAQFYPRHIEKEDTSFFPASRRYFDEPEWAALAEEFREFDRRLIHEKYRAVVESLEEAAAAASSVRA